MEGCRGCSEHSRVSVGLVSWNGDVVGPAEKKIPGGVAIDVMRVRHSVSIGGNAVLVRVSMKV